MFVSGRIFSQVRLSEFENGSRGPQPILLQMYEGAGQLNQTFVKISVRTEALPKPKLFQNVVRFVKAPLIETLEIAEVMGIQVFSPAAFDQRGNLGALFAHA